MHKTFLRALAALAGAAMPLALATPALAGPEDGEGCAGLQSNPNAYVCVISVDPTNVPTVGPTGTSTTVFSDNVCYVVGCRQVTVAVPDLGTEYPDGALLVVYYNGQNYSVGVVGGLPPTAPYVSAVGAAASTALGIALDVADILLEQYGEIAGWNEMRWLDCVVESETNDKVNISSSYSFSGYDYQMCTDYYFVV